ncbi:MAG: 4-hydroxythreonine-4-phosphate dehydrogenase PdxA [Chthoniobacterales bacterium]
MKRPVIGLTAGDLAGVGPEVLAAALASADKGVAEYRVIGRAEALEPGCPSRESAEAALTALEEAVELANQGVIDAVVTAPVCKHAMREIGFAFPGQTEFFAARAGVERFSMILTSERLTVSLVSIHVSLREAVEILSPELIWKAAEHLREFLLCRRSGEQPHIAVAGLNPHAGESGDIGDDEIRVIAPVVAKLERMWSGIFCGPISPDTLFHRAVAGEFDGVVCMYHDQGLIPLKLLAFDSGVNVTWGLPFIRTSPDHGTAFDIAGKGVASSRSMSEAIRVAVELVRGRS